MIGKVKQTVSSLSAEYEVISDTVTVGTIKIPDNRPLRPIYYYLKNCEQYVFKRDGINSAKNLIPKKSKEYVKYILYQDNQTVLSISSKRTKGFWGYSYYEINSKENTILVYVVGMGSEGIKIVFELDGKTIALIEKDATVVDNLDEYNIYALDKYFNATVFFVGYYDLLAFSNAGQINTRSKSTKYFVTTNKQLRAKYNEEFKQQFRNGG